MKIGELAKVTQTQTETIRHYEREGLLPNAERSAANYRVYDETHAKRLAFIRHCRSLDMTLGEIRTLLKFKDAPDEHCAEVNALLDEHIGHVEVRIRELKFLQRELKTLRLKCTSPATNSCGILAGLEQASFADQKSPDLARQRMHVPGTHQQVG